MKQSLSRLRGLLHPPRTPRARAIVTIFLSLVIFLAIGWLVYYSVLSWLRTEIIGVENQATRRDAQSLAQQVAGTVEAPLSAGRPPIDRTKQDLDGIIAPLLLTHPIVLTVAMLDKDDHVIYILASPNLEKRAPKLLKDPALANELDSISGAKGDTVFGIYQSHIPEVVKLSVLFKSPRDQLLGHMWLMIDPNVPQETVELFAGLILHLALGLLTLGALLAIAVMLTVRRVNSAQRQRLERDEAEKLAYVGALAAGLAHEIGNPLNALAMQLEMLEEDSAQGASDLVTKRLERIRAGLGGVDRTVREFLSYATPGHQSPRQVDLAPFIDGLCREFEENHQGVPFELERNVASGLAAWFDPHALRQVVTNLLSNGLRAQQQQPKPPPARLRIEAQRSGDKIDLVIDDAGSGVPEAIRGEIFDCFFTTRSEGTGLGLAIARRLTEMNRGELTLSEGFAPLGGARFRLRLPTRPNEGR